jgi:hypothetical protein
VHPQPKGAVAQSLAVCCSAGCDILSCNKLISISVIKYVFQTLGMEKVFK